MLPKPDSPEFPVALKAAREAKNWTRSELAKEAGIHNVMPRRYEDQQANDFCSPSEKNYKKLCRALGFKSPGDDDISLKRASIEQIVAELADRGIGATLAFPTPIAKGDA